MEIRGIPVVAFGSSVLLRKAFISGCADYIRDPIVPDEFYFRIVKNVKKVCDTLHWGEIEITRNSLSGRDKKIPINYQQFLILKLMINNRNIPIPRETFQYMLWGKLKDNSRDIDMNISIIRKRILEFKGIPLDIKTVRGFGYMIENPPCG